MGSGAHTLIAGAVALVCAGQATARAGECAATTAQGEPFAVCFDPNNRVYASAGSDGLGFGVDVRHAVETDDPDVTWHLAHGFASVVATRDTVAGALYTGRFSRHARDGHILLPIGPPQKIYVPFDIGADVDIGRLQRRLGDDRFDVGAIRAAVLLEFTRSHDAKRRIAIGPVTRWDIVVPNALSSVDQHMVTPFSAGALDLYVESASGLTTAHLRAESGATWSDANGWRAYLDAEAGVERVVLALNDQPLSVYATFAHKRGAAVPVSHAADSRDYWVAAAGARLALSWVRRDRPARRAIARAATITE